ncbi:winged helix-turn-helix domain-containing protein [Aliikangiella coralliicola]|uniref:OmpR/PhoB-type domain-containing protein n=1 Tax=Aliikangiella coralliicola TaxID=2592383 RepID=A0A545UI83_9GAMM|nr:winged helix-turn-helix domain-containing protein [Aliikangiella coralliicola]TQV89176.1 hypothetical protein FLL46_03335 [Aliikangiella coralliicola]
MKNLPQDTNFIADGWLIQPESLKISHPEKGKFSVQRKVMQVLTTLIEADNQLVEKQALINQVWQDTAITDNSLNQAISELRKIFSDSRKDPQFIETVPTKGYRFVAKAEATQLNELSIGEDQTETPSLIRKNRVAVTISSIMIGVLILLSQFWLRNDGPNDNKLNLTVAPNGQAIAFFIKQANGFYLHIQQTDQSAAPLATFIKRPESLAMAWSNDSQKIVYNATQKSQTFYAINVLELATGQTRYYKAAKDSSKHQRESLPANFDKPTESVEHQEFVVEGNKIEKVKYDEDEFFSAYFEQGQISSFSWQTVTPEKATNIN